MIKKTVSMLYALLAIIQGQTNMSTPGGESILVTFFSEPEGAEVYVSDTFLGNAPVEVRINSNTKTHYKLLIPSLSLEKSGVLFTDRDSHRHIIFGGTDWSATPFAIDEEPPWVQLVIEERRRKYESLDDYTKALLDCGRLVWSGASIHRPPTLLGHEEPPNDCPSREDFE